MALIKKITKIGNSYGIILPSDVMNLVNATPDSEVEIRVDGGKIILHPILENEKCVMESFAKFVGLYPDTLKKLAQ